MFDVCVCICVCVCLCAYLMCVYVCVPNIMGSSNLPKTVLVDSFTGDNSA